VFHRAGKPQPDVRELLELTDGDSKTWSMYADGMTMGLNQVEKPKTREKVMQYKPKNITELASFVAAVRPGFKSMLPLFLERQRFTYGIPAFDRLIQTREMSSSFVLFQEQTMKTLQYAGFTAPESYAAIKAIAKKKAEKVLPLKERFLQGFSEKILSENPDPHIAEDMSSKVWQIIEDTTDYSFNSSHAVCVALDSLYGAYAKAHYPLEYYTTLLQNYASKSDKDRIALVKEEMRKGFDIRVVPCKFRQDNRDFFIDRATNSIADALMSVKHITSRVADALYTMQDDEYAYFTDLLYEMDLNHAFNATSISVLIKMGYFSEFGSTGKLLNLFHKFRDGEHRFLKTYIAKTQQSRLNILRQLETGLDDFEIPLAEQVSFEVEHYGTVLSTFQTKRQFAVLEVDARYSPKLRLVNLATGATGLMKVRKAEFNKDPVQAGDVITLNDWEKRPAYRFIDGKAIPMADTYELWILGYTRYSNNNEPVTAQDA
jgi:DNA polymerase III alpha subunit